MKTVVLHISLLLCLLIGGACSKEVASTEAFGKWLSNAKNGCIVHKSVNGLDISVCYLPPHYMAALEMSKKNISSRLTYDSLVSAYQYQINVLMTIAGKNDQNVLYKDVTNPQEYSERLMALNFDLENMARLRANGITYAPSLTSMENTYGLGKDIKLNLLFTPATTKEELLKSDHLEFEYSDESFGIGNIICAFDKKNIHDNLPVFTGFK
ncbi:MAG: hypothetical protein QM534_16215 [Sediminibacterium sp.]|nr:hypothetical protein [Sediminibacterium sp.]